MSIEDPRLSMIDNTSAADEFDSAVEQHLGFASETVEGIEVAQAETPDAGRTDRLPAQQPVNVAAAVIPSEVTPNAENIVTLPAGIELDNLEFQVDGENLVLVLADGTEITVIGGAANIPTFLIGDVELPQVALFAALEESNINVAAGPDGTFSALSSPEASRNFVDNEIDAGPEDFALADLLGDTSFGDEVNSAVIFGGNGRPSITTPLTESFIYDEVVLADGVAGNQIISGRLPFNAGPDFGTITRVDFTGASNVDEEGLGPQVLAGFTSGGRPITVVSFTAPTDGAVLDFVAVEGRDSEGNLVFTLTITNRVTGDFTFELVGQLDHPDAGQNGSQDDLDDLLRLGFTYTVTDRDGDSVTGSFNIDVMDDAPEIIAGAQPISITVDEDDIDTPTSQGTAPNDGNVPDGSYTGTPGVNNGGPANATSTGSLAGLVNVGADKNLSFSLISIDAARTYLEGLGLKSNGLPLGFDLSQDGTIIGFVNSQAPGQAVPGEEYNVGADRLVFEFKLNPNGTFSFSLHDQIDHAPGAGQNTLTIDFGSVLQANDGDGDSVTLTGLVNVNVTDDVPVIATGAKPITITVDEDDIDTSTSKGNAPNDGNNPDGSYTGTPGVNTGGPANATSTGSLLSLVKVGADENVSFSLISIADARTYLEGLGLKSNGLPLGFDLSANGTIIGFVNSQAPGQASPGQEYNVGDDRLVFEFKLNPNGTFTFSLSDQLDHALGNGENTLTIDFGSVLQATDNDGDSVALTGLVKVNVTDDVPVIAPNATPITIKVDEDDIDTATSLGNAPNDGNNPDGSFTGTPGVDTRGPANATSTVSLSSLVKVGADESVSFSLINQAAMRTYLESLKLTSNGAQIGYDLRTDGTIIAFVNAPGGQVPGQTFDNGDRLVFEFKLNPNGTFTFSLSDQLDHPAGNGQNTLTIDFGSVLQATDNDGDSIKLTGLVKVDVTDDVPVIAPNATPITIKVDEDDIDTATSLGTSPNDGNVLDGSYTGTPSANTAGPANATSTGNLSSLVKVGADENVSFSLISTAAMRTYLESLKLTSNGAQIGYDLRTDGTIIAFVNAPGGQVPGQTFDNGDRLVFEFKLNPNGTFTFSLSDQLDHPAGNGQNTLTIDFGAVLQATDNDGDSVKLTGLVKVDVTDDVPELSGKTEARTVDEDDIKTSQSTGTSPADGNGDGSYTGGPNQGGNGPAFIDGSLAYLVKGGADDTVKFEFISEAALRLSLEGLGLSSKGEVLSYDLQGNVLWGFANVGAPGVSYDPNLGDRPVFKLTLNTNGSYTFELIDQLDHVKPAAGGSDENFALKPGVLAIDFGTVIKVTDFDGDSITLGKTFSIAIKDDVPELTGKTEARTVDEDDIRTSQSLGTSPADYDADGSWTGGPGQGGNGGAFIDGSLAYLVKGGADDAVKFSFSDDAASVLQGLGLKSKGELLSYEVKGNVLYAYDNKDGAAGYGANDRVVFKLTLNANGAYSFELIDQLDHVKPDAGADENFPLQPSGLLAINFGSVIEAKDFDGDSIKLGSAFSIEVRDDVPVHTGEVEKISLDAPQLVETTVGKVANFVLVLDTSGSVTVADIKAQVTGFLNSLANSDAEDVRVHIVRFAGDAAPVGTFDLIQDGAIVGSQLNAALTAIGQLPGGGATNYEAGLQQALQWIEGVPSQTISVDRTITSFDANTNGGNGQGNNDTAYIIGNGTTQIALVSGWRDPGTATGQLESVVGNTNNGWGVIDGDVDSGEILRFDFGAFNDFDGANGAYANVGNFSGVAVTSAQFTLDDNRWGGSTNFGYTVYFVGGGTQAAVINVNNDNTPLTITGTGPNLGKQIAYIEFTIPSGNGYGDVDLQSVVTAPIAPGTLENADVNQLIFLSDGQPNATQSGSTNATNALQAIIDEITKIESDSDGAGRDQKFTIEAYGVRANEAGLGNLAQVEGPGGGSTNVTSDRNLTSAMKDVLDSLVETTVTGQSVSATFDVNDLVAVGADDDITFSLGTNTSGLPQQLGGINLIYSFEAGLLVAKSGGATVFTLALSTDGKGTFTLYKPLGQADVNIDFSSIVQATDFDGDSIALATGKFVVTVVAPNVAPETQDVATTGNEDTVIPVQLSGSDANGTVAGFVIKTLPGNGGLFKDAAATEAVAIGDTVSGPVYFKPNADYNGPASFTFAAKDNQGLEDATPATASITVTPVNDAPTTDNRSATGDEDTTITVNLAGAGADIDGTVVGYVIKSLPQNGTLYLNSNGTNAVVIGQTVTGSIYFKPNADYNGPASFTFAAKDNLGLEDATPATASITVNPVNDAPTTDNRSASGNEDTTITVNLAGAGADIDGTVVGYVIKSLPQNGTLYLDSNGTNAVVIGQTVTGSVYFKPNADYNGPASFTFAAKDNLGLEDATPATASITVNPVNDVITVTGSNPVNMANYDKIIYSNTSFNPQGNNASEVSNFSVANHKIAVTLNSGQNQQSLTSGSFVSITTANSDISSSQKIIEIMTGTS
ncbi:von Willebrand factor type A [Agrobacterium albertimagni AOL15]|uniref:von Willebrand factor type A n=1 Tax=Agrobacterium albertimagni AOL15 TaxID=1156935 RepID=K2P9W2_9HYPH|nr:tandem-95 repeat protein [Agrobacterium albertimagni]EKF57693.1 von Willebrand factor type A [Agrobacterium albertimagni AOL15]